MYLFFNLLELKQTISTPKCTNQQLYQIINQQRNKSLINLSNQKLKDEDMEIIRSYLLRNNEVMNMKMIWWKKTRILPWFYW